MNAAAVSVMKSLPDLTIAYGISDEYRYLFTTLDPLRKCFQRTYALMKYKFCLSSQLRVIRKKKRVSLIKDWWQGVFSFLTFYVYSKLVTTIVSSFTAAYVCLWPTFMPDKPLDPSSLPTFDGRAIQYPNSSILRDYMSWRQVDCKMFPFFIEVKLHTEGEVWGQAISIIYTIRLFGRWF